MRQRPRGQKARDLRRQGACAGGTLTPLRHTHCARQRCDDRLRETRQRAHHAQLGGSRRRGAQIVRGGTCAQDISLAYACCPLRHMAQGQIAPALQQNNSETAILRFSPKAKHYHYFLIP